MNSPLLMKANLSILIPIYNFNVTEFIFELHRQAEACEIDFEILGYDDASDEKFKIVNRKVASLKHVRYMELKTNHGRSAIRNLLAKNAAYEHLLFFDCDLKITSGDFLKKYLDRLSDNKVVFGGRSYEPAPPLDKKKFLRWYYGVERESFSAGHRKKSPYKFFMTSNFLISKKIFLLARMNEDLHGYGHEDTVFAQDLKRRNIPVEHIGNPLCHIGLEDAEEFLLKTQQGILNLRFLIENNLIDEDVKIFRYYKFMKKMRLLSCIGFLFGIFEKKIRKNLLSRSPDLSYFDFYKLGLLVRSMR